MNQPRYAPGEREHLQERFERAFTEDAIKPRRELNVMAMGLETKADLFVILSMAQKARKAGLDLTIHIKPSKDPELNQLAARTIGRLRALRGADTPILLVGDMELVKRTALEAIEHINKMRDTYDIPILTYEPLPAIEPKVEPIQEMRQDRNTFRQFQTKFNNGRPNQKRQHAMIRPPRRGGRG